jgi:DHA2 family multidrug resistance protein
MLFFGFTLLAGSSFMLSDLNLQVSRASVIWPSVVNGIAISFIFVPLTTATMSQLGQQQIGNATGLYNLMRNLGGSIGIAFVTTMLALLDQQAHLWAFVDNFYLFGLLALGGIPLLFLFKRVQYAKKPAAAGH